MNLDFIESSPIPVKSILSMMGMCKEIYRLPMTPIKPENKKILKDELKAVGLIK